MSSNLKFHFEVNAMSDKMFIDPATGDMLPEGWYHKQNIDLATVIECVEVPGGLGFDIRLENIERMDVKTPKMFRIFAHFCATLIAQAMQEDDDKEREELQAIAAYISHVMMKKLGHETPTH
jgi:hypothetical protein